MATEQSEHDEAAEYLSLVEAPWERPLSEAAARARQEPGPETLGHALRLTADERLL